jgi:hypothetical protein
MTWKNEAIELEDPPRKGKRVVVCPKELSHLDTVLNSGDPSVDSEHLLAYQVILDQAQTFEVPPVFIKEDAESIMAHPEMSLKVPSWMCIAERIATGSRKRVPEDGPDTWHSDDESKTDIEADKETNMYTSEMDPNLGPQKLSMQEAARQRAAFQASRFSTSSTEVSSDFGNSIVSSQASSRQATPMNSDDDEYMTEDQKRAVNLGRKMSLAKSVPRCPSAPGTAPRKAMGGDQGTRSRAVPEPPMPNQEERARKAKQDERDFLEMLDNPKPVVPPSSSYTVEPKAVASQRAPADQPKGAKAPPPTKGQVKGQESPETKVSKPMETRRQAASRAGSLRGVDGSGSIGAVCGSSSPARKPGS